MKKGTRIYYTGDRANDEGIGTITMIEDGYADIRFDDGREFQAIPVAGISDAYKGTCATRFVTLEAYNIYRVESLRAAGYKGEIKLSK